METYTASVGVAGYSKTDTERESEYLIVTYWVGAPTADVKQLVSAPSLKWGDLDDMHGALYGFTHVANATAHDFSPYCNLQVFQVHRPYWPGRDLRARWRLSAAQADAVADGTMDLIAVAVDSC